jgi:hypothetical protein
MLLVYKQSSLFVPGEELKSCLILTPIVNVKKLFNYVTDVREK